MHRHIIKIILIICFLLASSITAHSDEVTMAFGISLPPYVIAVNNSGMEMDIIRESLKFRGHTLKPEYVPLARVPLRFINKKSEAVHRDGGRDLSSERGYYADISITYQDVMITLKEKGIKIGKPEDITGLHVIAFQGAVNQYPKWLEPVRKAGNYYEINEQLLQVKTLHKGRYDVVVADKNIMTYFTNIVRKEGNIPILPTEIHYFSEPYDQIPVFRNPKIRDDFNAGLKNLHETGMYQKIIDTYLK